MKSRDGSKIIVSFFGICFILGVVYINLLAYDYLAMTSIFNQYYLQQFKEQTIVINDVIFQIAKIRIVPFIILFLLSYTKFSKPGVILFISWYGFLWGAYLAMGVSLLGIKGIILCVMGVLPQGFFYLPAYIMGLLYTYFKPLIKWSAVKTIVIVLSIFCGIVLECYISPSIVKWFIGII